MSHDDEYLTLCILYAAVMMVLAVCGTVLWNQVVLVKSPLSTPFLANEPVKLPTAQLRA